MPKPIIYEVGQSIADAKLLAIQKGITAQHNQYLVKYACCGLEQWIGHKAIGVLRRRETTCCIKCSHKKAAEVYWANHRPKIIEQIFVPGWGMTLGSFNRSR